MTQNIKTKYLDMFFNPACAPPGPPGWASGAEQAPQGNPRRFRLKTGKLSCEMFADLP